MAAITDSGFIPKSKRQRKMPFCTLLGQYCFLDLIYLFQNVCDEVLLGEKSIFRFSPRRFNLEEEDISYNLSRLINNR
jgi:hypothetical protein